MVASRGHSRIIEYSSILLLKIAGYEAWVGMEARETIKELIGWENSMRSKGKEQESCSHMWKQKVTTFLVDSIIFILSDLFHCLEPVVLLSYGFVWFSFRKTYSLKSCKGYQTLKESSGLKIQPIVVALLWGCYAIVSAVSTTETFLQVTIIILHVRAARKRIFSSTQGWIWGSVLI